MSDGDREALDTAQGLVTAMRGLAAEVKRLRTYGRHNRWFVVFDIALTVLLAATGFLSVHAADQASRVNSAQLALCRAGNVARHQQVQLWDYVVHLSPPKTKQAREVTVKFEHHLHAIFAPRDCTRLGNSKP